MANWFASGPVLEIPARAPGLPINLWLRWAAIGENFWDWEIVDGGTGTGRWKRSMTPITGPALAVGDTALAGQATWSLAQIRRSTQWNPLDTDDWGVALA